MPRGIRIMNSTRVDRFLQKLNRYISYILIAVVIAMLMAGYRMTGNFTFIPRGLADLLHRIYLNVVFLILFITHTLLSLRIVFKRKSISGKYIDVTFILIGVGLFGFFTYLSLKLILPI
jgi:hypothetical protein